MSSGICGLNGSGRVCCHVSVLRRGEGTGHCSVVCSATVRKDSRAASPDPWRQSQHLNLSAANQERKKKQKSAAPIRSGVLPHVRLLP